MQYSVLQADLHTDKEMSVCVLMAQGRVFLASALFWLRFRHDIVQNCWLEDEICL